LYLLMRPTVKVDFVLIIVVIKIVVVYDSDYAAH
jgi:hypothetical protein